MSWTNHYDKINQTDDGEVVIFGGHYTFDDAILILEHFEWECWDFTKVENVYIRFGFHYDDYTNERSNGWYYLCRKPKSMRGCILGTLMVKGDA